MLKTAPTLYGPRMSSTPNRALDNGITMRGDTNCPKYRAADSSGMTVVAESRPPLMLAMVFR